MNGWKDGFIKGTIYWIDKDRRGVWSEATTDQNEVPSSTPTGHSPITNTTHHHTECNKTTRDPQLPRLGHPQLKTQKLQLPSLLSEDRLDVAAPQRPVIFLPVSDTSLCPRRTASGLVVWLEMAVFQILHSQWAPNEFTVTLLVQDHPA